MRPPCCEVCDASPSTDDAMASFGLARFADHEPLPAMTVGHPRGLGWFCADHLADAQALTEHTLRDAVARLRAGSTTSPPTPVPVVGRTALVRDLEWADGDGTSGVSIDDAELLWWYRPGGLGGRFGESARSQTHDDYRTNGPAVSCPAAAEAHLDAALGRTR